MDCISKCMLGLQACLFKYISVAAFRIYAQRCEDAAKRGGWRPCSRGKSWNCVFEFLWEPYKSLERCALSMKINCGSMKLMPKLLYRPKYSDNNIQHSLKC